MKLSPNFKKAVIIRKKFYVLNPITMGLEHLTVIYQKITKTVGLCDDCEKLVNLRQLSDFLT